MDIKTLKTEDGHSTVISNMSTPEIKKHIELLRKKGCVSSKCALLLFSPFCLSVDNEDSGDFMDLMQKYSIELDWLLDELKNRGQ